MRRCKFILVALLSVLGLAVPGYSAIAAFAAPGMAAPVVRHSSVFASADERGKHGAAGDFSAGDPIARALNRRAGMQPGQDRFSVPLADFELPSVAALPPLNIFSGAERALELARRWQFDYRAAGEPRAPSTVS